MYFNLLQTPRNNFLQPLRNLFFFVIFWRICDIAIISSNTQFRSHCLLVFKRENNHGDDELHECHFHSASAFASFFLFHPLHCPTEKLALFRNVSIHFLTTAVEKFKQWKVNIEKAPISTIDKGPFWKYTSTYIISFIICGLSLFSFLKVK